VVAPDQASIRELISNGRTGLLFQKGDAESFAKSVLRFLEDKNLSRVLGDAARAHAVRHLSWRQNAEKVLEACMQATLAVSQGTDVTVNSSTFTG